MKLENYEINFLIGCLLGDGHMRIDKACINPRFKCDHGERQAEYCKWKQSMIPSLEPKYKIATRLTPDKRTGKLYTSAKVETRNKEVLLPIYNMFYKNKIKVISEEIYEYFNELSLAVMFMDDGYKTTNSIMISTDCFTIEELNKFNDFLYQKFNIKFNIIKRNKMYLPVRYYNIFKETVLPFIHPTMMYKFPK